MSTTTPNLNLIQPSKSEKGGWTTYITNNAAIDDAYGAYLNDREQSLENIAPIEGATASKNYTVGSYLVKDGGLYKVTAAIASGESIVVGTNVVATCLNDAVVELNTTVATIQDSVVHTKTVNGWRLTQYPDGTVTAYTWWRLNNIGAFIQWGNLYNVKILDPVTYPITFSEAPCVRLELYGASAAISSLYLYGEGTGTVSPQVWAMRPDAASSGLSLGLGMFATGRAPLIR